MQLSAAYDDIATQYVTNFADVYELAQRLSQNVVRDQLIERCRKSFS